ncbi:MAG: hypothetical protein II529_05355, partial [Erysipelotrichaceae bacterium]|nr:hypothetical protein [Erysipelotrichaceae bacterium]
MYRIIENDPYLKPFERDIKLRMKTLREKKRQILNKGEKLKDFANAHKYYGFHRSEGGWFYREWAPAADQLYLTGDFNNWNWTDTPLEKKDNGNWEVFLPGDTLYPGCKVMTIVDNGGTLTEHIPLYALRVTQDWQTFRWCCEVWDIDEPFEWTDKRFKCDEPLLIYEAHVGMSCEDYRIAGYREFADNVLPHVQDLGYNTIQLMAIMEHPLYSSFGYQVSSFYAASSRFGYPND